MKNYTIAFILFILSSTIVFSQTESVAMIAVTRGDVTLIRASNSGEMRTLKAKDKLFIKDQIQTGARGRVQIIFTDGSIVRLGKKAKMTIDKYSYSNQNKTGNFLISIKEGSFRVMGGNITKFSPENFKTETPTATIGVRGSMYAGRTSKSRTEIVFLGGKGVFMRNKRGETKEYRKPGESGWTRLGTPPTKTGKRIMFSGEVYLPRYIAPVPNSFEEPIVSGLSDYAVASSITTVPRTEVTDGINPVVNEKALISKVRLVDSVRVMIGRDSVTNNTLFTGKMVTFTDGSIVPPLGTFNLQGHDKLNPTLIDGHLELDPNTNGVSLIAQDQFGVTGQGDLSYISQPTSSTSFIEWGQWTLTKDQFINEVRISDRISGYWIGGERTPGAVVQNLVQHQAFGYYYGSTNYTNSNGVSEAGNIDINLDFGTGAVGGSLYFTGGSLSSITSGTLSPDGIKGTLDGDVNSSIDGLFYGPNAEGLGGTFFKEGTDGYHGVFESKTSGGDSIITPYR